MRLDNREERAQDTYEYMLIVGAIVVAMVAALLGLGVAVAWLVGAVCPSVDTADVAAAFGSCITS